MDNREMDAMIAEWMGRKLHFKGGGASYVIEAPCYSSDLNAMALAEAEVARRGLEKKYVLELKTAVGFYSAVDNAERGYFLGTFGIIAATAAQRAEALCRLIDAEAKQ